MGGTYLSTHTMRISYVHTYTHHTSSTVDNENMENLVYTRTIQIHPHPLLCIIQLLEIISHIFLHSEVQEKLQHIPETNMIVSVS